MIPFVVEYEGNKHVHVRVLIMTVKRIDASYSFLLYNKVSEILASRNSIVTICDYYKFLMYNTKSCVIG